MQPSNAPIHTTQRLEFVDALRGFAATTAIIVCSLTGYTLAKERPKLLVANSGVIQKQARMASVGPLSQIDLATIGHIAPKGRVQDKDYNQLAVVESLISHGKESIPFLISKLDDKTKIEGNVVDYWSDVRVGDVALIIPSNFFTDSSWQNATIAGVGWDELLERRGNKDLTSEQVLRNYVAQHGRSKIKNRWQKIWAQYRYRIFWDESERCFKVRSSSASAQTNCLQTASEVPPRLSAETQRDFEAKLNEALALFEKQSQSAERIIWLGRRTAYLGRYKDAIRIYTEGIERFPADARLYRHRGHRLITLRCFDAAVADLEKASTLIKGKPDEIEPDGLPNARNIPTSTLQSNIWYHLGLAHYLKGDFRRALTAYQEAEKVSKNADMLVATTHWLYMTLRRLGREKEAGRALLKIKDNLDVIENADYYKMIGVYKGRLKPADVWDEISQKTDSLSNATIGYGLGNWFLYNGQRAESERVFRQVTSGNQWASFGYIAAEAELKRGP
jgi:tetratricopeptide (TPR) repeat protein